MVSTTGPTFGEQQRLYRSGGRTATWQAGGREILTWIESGGPVGISRAASSSSPMGLRSPVSKKCRGGAWRHSMSEFPEARVIAGSGAQAHRHEFRASRRCGTTRIRQPAGASCVSAGCALESVQSDGSSRPRRSDRPTRSAALTPALPQTIRLPHTIRSPGDAPVGVAPDNSVAPDDPVTADIRRCRTRPVAPDNPVVHDVTLPHTMRLPQIAVAPDDPVAPTIRPL